MKRNLRINGIINLISNELKNETPEARGRDYSEELKVKILELSKEINKTKAIIALFRAVEKTLLYRIIRCKEELMPEFAVAYSIDFGKLLGHVDYSIMNVERLILPSDTDINKLINLLVKYYYSNHYLQDFSNFNEIYKLEIDSIHKLIEISKYYGEDWIYFGRLKSVTKLRNLIYKSIEHDWKRGKSIEVRSIFFNTLHSRHFNNEINLLVFESDIEEGIMSYLYNLIIQLPDSDGIEESKTVLNLLKNHSYHLLLTYPYIRTNTFAGFFMGMPLEYLRYWVMHDRLFTSIQYNYSASSYLAAEIFKNIDNIEKFAFCNIYLYKNINKFTNRYNNRFDSKKFYQKISNISDNYMVSFCNEHFLKNPGRISSEIALEFINFISTKGPAISESSILPLSCGASINNLGALLINNNEGDKNIFNNALPYSGNFIFEKSYKDSGYCNIGLAFEDAFKKIIDRLGLKYSSGCYLFEGKLYEVDCLILHDNNIYCFELKTKPIRAKSRDGDVGSLVNDLILSFLSATTQALRLRLALSKNSVIKIFKNQESFNKQENPIEIIEFHLNKTKFINFSLIPFGVEALSQPVVTDNLFNMFTRWEFGIPDISKEQYNNIIKYQKIFRDLLVEFSDLFPEEKDLTQLLGISSKFIPFDEIYTFATLTGSGDEFIKILTSNLNMQNSYFKQSRKYMEALKLYRYRVGNES